MSWDLLIVSPPRGDKDQAVGAHPDLEEHAAPVAQDGHQAGVLLQRVPEPQQHAQLVGKPGGEAASGTLQQWLSHHRLTA